MRDSTLIADRYQLVDLIGAGAMGEVWRARDTKFETRVVAVKLLKDEQTRREDAESRERLLRMLRREAQGVDAALGASLLTEALHGGRGEDAIRIRVRDAADASGRLSEAAMVALFDALIDDPAYSENARLRAKLRRLFRDEANSVADLDNEHIVRITDYGDDRGTPYLAMDYISGVTLLRLIQRGEPMPRDVQLRLMEDLCNGLAYAHKRKLVHRDIKPANLIVDDGTKRLKILDFGVVRRLQDAGDSTMGLPIGTLCYMSPEQIAGSAHVDHRSDVFSVGVVFYELLSGRKAFPPGHGITDLMSRIQHAPPPPLEGLVANLEPRIAVILARALEKDPERRYQDLADMQQDLSQVRAGLTRAPGRPATGQTTIAVRGGNEPLIPRLLRLGEQALEAGEPSVAIDRANEVLSLDPSNALAIGLKERGEIALEDRRVQSELGRIETLIGEGHLPEARRAWSGIRDRRPDADDVRAVGRRLEQAEREDADRRDREARLARAVERARQSFDAGAFERARDAAREALAIDPNHAEARALAETAVSRLDARRRAQEQEADRQRRVTALVDEADKALSARRFDDALAAVAAAIALAPERTDLLERRRAVERAKENARLDALLADVDALARQGRLDEAIARLGTDQTLDPRVAARLRELESQLATQQQPTVLVLPDPPAPVPSPPLPRPPAPAPPMPPAPAPAPSRRPMMWWVSGSIAAAIGVSIVTTLYVRKPSSPPPLPPNASPSIVTVNFHPWARVRIVSASDGAVVADTQPTPFVVALAPGRYRAEGENGDVTKPAQKEFEVVSGQPASVDVDMPGFDPNGIADQVLRSAK